MPGLPKGTYEVQRGVIGGGETEHTEVELDGEHDEIITIR